MGLQEKGLVDKKTFKPRHIDLNKPYPGAENFTPYKKYTRWTVILHDKKLYRAITNFQATEDFDPKDWELITTTAAWGTLMGDIEEQEDLKEKFDNVNNIDNNLQDQINTLYEEKPINLTGALLTRVIHGFTPVQKILLDPSVIFIEGKTLISDVNGTIGVYKQDIDSATIEVETLSASPYSGTEPTLLGVVPDNISLPATVDQAVADRGWHTPRIDDYVTVQNDETMNNQRVEWYIADITDGNITWGNPVVINASDYQQQTSANDSGKVLTGGASAGTFGNSVPIDTVITANSNNLITSGAVKEAIDNKTVPTGANLSQQNSSFGQSVRHGTSQNFARSDHYHAIPNFLTGYRTDSIIHSINPNLAPILNSSLSLCEKQWIRVGLTRNFTLTINARDFIDHNVYITVTICSNTTPFSAVTLHSSTRGVLQTLPSSCSLGYTFNPVNIPETNENYFVTITGFNNFTSYNVITDCFYFHNSQMRYINNDIISLSKTVSLTEYTYLLTGIDSEVI